MTRPLWIVWLKEMRENTRDRRTLLSALVLGPVLGPVLFGVLVSVTLNRSVTGLDERVSLPIDRPELAPHLVDFLSTHGLDAVPGPASMAAAEAAIRAGEHEIALVLSDAFGSMLEAGRPARVTLVYDQSETRAAVQARRVQSVLDAYSGQLAALRVLARGLDPGLLRPLAIVERDLSTAASRSVLLLGMLTYFLLLSMLMGGFYLAIDTTAGERERGSLEPLLTTPVSRASLLLGKMGATLSFMALSLALTLVGFTFALALVPLEPLGMRSAMSPWAALKIFGVLIGFAPLGAALMTLVASFTRSYKEAQTYLTLVLLLPTLPLVFASLLEVRSAPALMWIPSLSQHLIVTTWLRAEPTGALAVLSSVGGSLLASLVVGALALRLYRREALLG
jgi:sodium transport system permease protein